MTQGEMEEVPGSMDMSHGINTFIGIMVLTCFYSDI